MKIQDQVLSIDQVRELQELGFDVDKYSSITKFSCENCEYSGDCVEEIGSEVYMTKNYVCDSMNGYKTLTIGDIIDILPVKIAPIYYLEISKNLVDYCSNDKSINGEVEERLIDALFETLKWCIKEKHIAL